MDIFVGPNENSPLYSVVGSYQNFTNLDKHCCLANLQVNSRQINWKVSETNI